MLLMAEDLSFFVSHSPRFKHVDQRRTRHAKFGRDFVFLFNQ
uniref:Uncharacterized protein n=1 Tax=Arundo donax TaxID=35708 RepID=A0A0A9ATH1_ARUDO